jgi:hypothetical protein
MIKICVNAFKKSYKNKRAYSLHVSPFDLRRDSHIIRHMNYNY